MRFPPQRIVCLTEETVETLYLLGEQDRIVGVSVYAERPPEVKDEKPRISAFTSANIPKILDLKPDLVLTFSDLQADIVAELIRAGLEVHAFNQRDVAGILAMIRTLGGLIGVSKKANLLADSFEARIDRMREESKGGTRKRVFFEEWDEPLISAIGWVSELIEIAGGEDVFAHLRTGQLASERIVTADAVIEARPDVIMASWCGKKVRPDKIAARPGWSQIPAIANGQIHELDPAIILQPGPAALTDGVDRMVQILQGV